MSDTLLSNDLLTESDIDFLEWLDGEDEAKCESTWEHGCSVAATHRRVGVCPASTLWCQNRYNSWISGDGPKTHKCGDCKSLACYNNWRVFPV